MGHHILFLYHAALNIPGPMRSSTFFAAQNEFLLAAEDVANESMLRAVEDLRVARNTIQGSEYVTAVGTLDGAYQQRS